MMGTLATLLASTKIRTSEDLYYADVEGDVEDVGGVLKIMQMRVKYHLKVPEEKANDAREAFSSYLQFCPAAQTVKGCISIHDELLLEQ